MAKSRKPKPRKPATERTLRATLSFKRRDVARAIKSAKDAGLPIDRVEVDPVTRKITVIIAKPGALQGRNTWDEVLTNAEDTKRTP
jgi:hypothetical protein